MFDNEPGVYWLIGHWALATNRHDIFVAIPGKLTGNAEKASFKKSNCLLNCLDWLLVMLCLSVFAWIADCLAAHFLYSCCIGGLCSLGGASPVPRAQSTGRVSLCLSQLID